MRNTISQERTGLFGLGACCVLAWTIFAAWLLVPGAGATEGFAATAFLVLGTVFQSALFTTPVLAVYAVARISGGRSGMAVAFSLLFTLTLTLLWVDQRVWALYGFHINGFVMNLVFTPGGIEALDAAPSAWVTMGAAMLGVWLLTWVVVRWLMRLPMAFAQLRMGTMLIVALLCGVAEKAMYGWAHLRGDERLVTAALLVPGYIPVTFQHFARAVGSNPAQLPRGPRAKNGRFNYPLQAVVMEPAARAFNIVWLVAESLRADQLNRATMPQTWAFSERNVRLEHHFSGGNNTRMGMFTMFYGLHGPYWFKALAAQREPVLFDVLNRGGYDIQAYTSAHFTYPEFDRTIFASVPADRRHEYQGNDPRWQRDAGNVDALLAGIDARTTAQPFFRFMFFETTHATYEAPGNEGQVNYATLDPARDIDMLKQRYARAAHYLDGQIGRVLDGLAQASLLDDTIVIVTGDHGEEFMEHGRWGHGSTFGDEQLQVPLVLHVPGMAPRVIDMVTTNVDVVPTLLPLLGVTNASGEFSVGRNLLCQPSPLAWRVATQWTGVGIVDANTIASIPLHGVFGAHIVDRETRTPISSSDYYESRRPQLMAVVSEINRFVRK